MARKDFVTSIVLISFSLSVVVLSYTMPRLEHRNIDPYSAPGVVPGMIGLILLCLSLILFFRSISRGGYRLFPNSADQSRGAVTTGATKRVLLTLVISLIYAIGLLGRVDYTIATLLYIFSFIVIFEYRPQTGLGLQKKMIGLALVQALIGAVSITLVFRKLFLVDLP